MLALKSFLGAVVLLMVVAAAFQFSSAPRAQVAPMPPAQLAADAPPPTRDGRSIAASLAEAARTMKVELDEQCLEAIAQHVAAFGYDKGVVSAKGTVLIRDVHGVDTWVCR